MTSEGLELSKYLYSQLNCAEWIKVFFGSASTIGQTYTVIAEGLSLPAKKGISS